jgi:hypothetical protein
MSTTRWVQDAQLNAAAAYLGAPTVTTYSDVFDLGAVQGGVESGLVEFKVVVPAMANNTDTSKTATLTMQTSAAETSGYAACDPDIVSSVPGVATSGSAVKTILFRPASDIKRYVRFALYQDSAGTNGDLTGYAFTISLLVGGS